MRFHIIVLLFLLNSLSFSGTNPSFEFSDLDLEGVFDIQAAHGIVGIDFLSDGRMVICTWGGDRSNKTQGKLVILSNVLDPSKKIEAVEILSDLMDPAGMKVVDDVIYIGDKRAIIQINPDGSGKKNLVEVPYYNSYHEYNFSAVELDGYLYTALGQGMGGASREGRGGFMKINLENGEHEIFAGGAREANGIGFGPDKQLFATDNQGNWLPTSKLNHVEEGDFFDYRLNGDTPFIKPTAEAKRPAIWFDHADVAQSPTQPIFLDKTVFAGQMLVGEYKKCRLNRVFLERVDGVYQGAVFPFADNAHLTSTPHRLIWGPDGNIYYGGIGSGNGWTTNCGEEAFITQMKPADKEFFDILALRSIENGFEFEFTAPAGQAAGNKDNYKLRRWGYIPQQGYGQGNRAGLKNVAIQSVELSQDGLKATVQLDPNDLKHESGEGYSKSTQYNFRLSDIESKSGDALQSEEAWYTLNEQGPADKMGCMDEGFEEYDGEAVYDDGLQCKNEIVDLRIYPKSNLSLTHKNRIFKITGASTFDFSLMDLKGNIMFQKEEVQTEYVDLNSFRGGAGIYLVVVSGENQTAVQKVILSKF